MTASLTVKLDDLIIGTYQEILLSEIEKARKHREILVFHNIPEVSQIVESYLRELGIADSVSVDELLLELVKRGLLIVYPGGKVRTRHLELIIRTIYSRAYPGALASLEYIILSPRTSPLPSYEERSGEELYKIVYEYFSHVSRDDALADDLSKALVYAFMRSIAGKRSIKDGMLSEYQYLNLCSLFNYASKNVPSISLLAAPTGTGKTWVFILYAIARVIEAKIKGQLNGVKVIIVYPRKALARDQFERILKLLNAFNDELKLRRLDKYTISLGILDGDSPNTWEEIIEIKRRRNVENVEFRGIKCPSCGGKLIYGISSRKIICSQCYRTYDYIGDIREWVFDEFPDILITNLWALNYRLISRRSKSLLKDTIRCLIIDEAHVLKDLEGAFISYLLCRIILRLAMQHKGLSTDPSAALRLDPDVEYDVSEWLRDYLKDVNFTIILSSATISTAPTESERLSDAEAFSKELVNPKLYQIFENICKGRGFKPVIYQDYDKIYQDIHKSKLRRKLDIVIITAPHPSRGIETIAQSTAICSLFWSKVFNQKFLLFADNREVLDRLHHFINDIIIGERGEIYDHVFLTEVNPGTRLSRYIRKSWLSYKKALSENKQVLVNVLNDPLSWLVFIHAMYFGGILARYKDLSQALSFIEKNQEYYFKELLHAAKNICDDIFYKRYDPRTKRFTYLEVHYADLSKFRRQDIEERLKKADLTGALCTSTLELGIDIDCISVVIQYKPPISAESFIQRIGRAGRKPETMYTAVGFLLLSNFDTLYLNEHYAAKALFDVRPRPLPLNNSRIQSNAIFYAILDLLVYLDHKTFFSRRLSSIARTESEVSSILQTLIRYEKCFTSIISSLYGFPKDIVVSEYNMFKSYLKVLYDNLTNIDVKPISIKNSIYNVLEKMQEIQQTLTSKVLVPLAQSQPNLVEMIKIVGETISYVEKLYDEVYRLDLYCEAFPELLVRNKNRILNNLRTYIKKIKDYINSLYSFAAKSDNALIYSSIKNITEEITKLEDDFECIIDFLDKGVSCLFTLNLKKILR